MFKKVTVILFVLLLLSSCSLKNINLTEPESASFDSGNDNCPNTDDIIADEYRGVWINYNELSMKSVGGGTAEDFKIRSIQCLKISKHSGLILLFSGQTLF